MATPTNTALGSDTRDGPIGMDALPWLDAREVAHRNADLALFRRLIFTVGGAPIRFERDPQVDNAALASAPALWLSLKWSGVPLMVAVSPAMADAMAQTLADVGIDQLGGSGTELLAQLMLSPRLPAGLNFHQIAIERDALAPMPQAPELLGTWRGRHPDSGEASAHEVTLWAAPGFPLASLLAACAGWASSRQASPLAGLPIALPLVAARWCIDASALVDLAVGDVLMLG